MHLDRTIYIYVVYIYIYIYIIIHKLFIIINLTRNIKITSKTQLKNKKYIFYTFFQFKMKF